LICLIIHFFRIQWDGGFIASSQVVLFNWDFDLDFLVLSNFNAAFYAHPMLAPIANLLVNPTRTRILAFTWVANIATMVLIFGIPCVGYLLFSEPDDEENIFHYLDPFAPEVIVGKCAVIVGMLVSTSIYTFFQAKSLVHEIFPRAENDGIPVWVAGLATSLLTIGINLMGDVWISMVYALAAVACSLIAFVLPPVYFFVQYRLESKKWAIAAGFVFVIGGAIMIISLVVAILDMIELSEEE
jgi:amino acid permease